MNESSEQDTSKWREREVTHSRNVIANAKVVVTFSAGIAAAFVTQVMHKTDDPVLAITIVVVLLPPGHHEGELTARSACCAKWRARVA